MWALVEWVSAGVQRHGHRLLVVMHLVVQFRRGVALKNYEHLGYLGQ